MSDDRTLTAEEIAELRRLEQIATPRPWRAKDRDLDTELSVAARNALPRLLDEVERLREQVDSERAGAYLSGWRAGREAAFSAVYTTDIQIPDGPESPLPVANVVGPVIGMHWATNAHLKAIRSIPEPNPNQEIPSGL